MFLHPSPVAAYSSAAGRLRRGELFSLSIWMLLRDTDVFDEYTKHTAHQHLAGDALSGAAPARLGRSALFNTDGGTLALQHPDRDALLRRGHRQVSRVGKPRRVGWRAANNQLVAALDRPSLAVQLPKAWGVPDNQLQRRTPQQSAHQPNHRPVRPPRSLRAICLSPREKSAKSSRPHM